MSKQGYVKIPLPKKDYDVLTKFAKEHGYESVDAFCTEAILEWLLHQEKKKTQLSAKEILKKYEEAKTEKPDLKFADFLDTLNP